MLCANSRAHQWLLATSKWFFKKSFCCGFNLSNDDIISVLCKRVMLRFVTTCRSENEYGFEKPGLKTGVENDNFLG